MGSAANSKRTPCPNPTPTTHPVSHHTHGVQPCANNTHSTTSDNEVNNHSNLTHWNRSVETHTTASHPTSRRQQHHTLRFLRSRTRLRILTQTKQCRSRSRNPLQQGRNRHTQQHGRDLPMVQPTQRQRQTPHHTKTTTRRTTHNHQMVVPDVYTKRVCAHKYATRFRGSERRETGDPT